MQRLVKGTLFLDYVRMIRSRKRIDWSQYLTETDLAIVAGHIEPTRWYALETFERMGLGILEEIAGGDMQAVYSWGKDHMVDLFRIHETLVAEDDPMESLMRYKVLQRSFFNFDGLDVVSLTANNAILRFHYFMGDRAEEASVHQTIGFFERLLVRAGAENLTVAIGDKVWEGADATSVEFRWDLA